MKTKQELFDYLKSLSIRTQTYAHEPLYTVEQAEKAVGFLPGGHVKNLFLKDDKNRLWLVSALTSTAIKLKDIEKAFSAPKLRFAQADLLKQYLGLLPGSVTPFGLINDTDHKVTVILDKKLFDYELINIHPLSNDATTSIAPHDLKNFLDSLGAQIFVVDFERERQTNEGYNENRK